MSAVKNKNNIKIEQPTTINKEQLRPHITENIGLTEQTKNSDRLWPIHPNARHVSRKAHAAKKNK